MTFVHAATVIDARPLTLAEFARALGAEDRWVMRLVEVRILRVDAAAQPPERWQFGSADLGLAREALRLERDFGANLDAAALILDLQAELRRAKALLAAHGL